MPALFLFLFKVNIALVTSDQKPDSVTYVINGVRGTKADLKALDPDKVESLEMLPPEKAKEFFPEADGKHQVLFVTTNDSETGKQLKEKIDKSFNGGKIVTIRNMSISGNGESSDIAPPAPSGTMAYSISSSSSDDDSADTGRDKNISAVALADVKPKVSVKTSTIIKKQVYISAMPKAEVTVSADVAPEVITVEGTDKTTAPDDKPRKVFVRGFTNNDRLTIDGEGHALFIIDGKEATSLKNVSPEDIKSITVLKDGAAEKQYGEKGKNGVVVITTKKGK